MGHWTQYEEDAARLPEGMKRIGYDTDTERYTFQDCYTGTLYRSEPGNAYGALTPMNSVESNIQRIRPNAFASTDPARQRVGASVHTSITSFNDFLPSSAITSPPKPCSRNSISNSSSGSLLRDTFRKVKGISSVTSKFQATVSHDLPDRTKSSLPSSVSSGYSSHNSPSSSPRPTRRLRGYSKLPDPRQEEDKKALLRSKTISSVSSSRSSRYAPTRASSRSSRVSTTSTITPMITR